MKSFFIIFFLISLILAFFLSPFASDSPDGLEKVAEGKGFIEKQEKIINSPIPDYVFPSIKNERLSTSIAGIIGTILAFCVSSGIGVLMIKRK